MADTTNYSSGLSRQAIRRLQKVRQVAAAPAPPPRPKSDSHIYFIECAGFVKIGISTRPQKRLVGIRVSNPFDCQMIGLMKGDAFGEQQIHDFIRSHHHRGEWYRLTDELRGLIDYLLGPDDAPSPAGWP